MTIDFANTLDKNGLLRTLEMADDFKTVWRRMPPDPPSDSPLRRLRDSSIIKGYPDFTYSKGWRSELCFNVSYPMHACKSYTPSYS